MIDIANTTPILASFFVSFITTLLGYFRTTDPESFNLGKFIATIIIGVCIGMVTSILGWDYATAQEWLAQAGLTIWIYWLAGIIAKKLPNFGTT